MQPNMSRDFILANSKTLIEQKMQKACWQTLCAKNEGQYKDLCVELEKNQ